MAMATVYWAPPARRSVAVTLPSDGICRRPGLIGVEDVSWQEVRKATVAAEKMTEPRILVRRLTDMV